MEHPNLGRLRRSRSTLVIAERARDAEIRRAMAERPNSGPSMYTAEDVAKAAGISRPRVYQILDKAKAAVE